MRKTILPIACCFIAFAATHADEAATEKKDDPFTAADENGDEKLSAEEFAAMMLTEFDRMDKDESGDLTGDELGDRPSPVVVAMDTDKDAKITREEYTTAVGNLFKELDTNEDGGVSKGELAVLTAISKGSGSKGSGTKKPAPPATGN